MAATLWSLRCLRRCSSSSALSEEGSVFEASTTAPLPLATTIRSTPPGRVATTSASPPPAGRLQSAAGASSSSGSSASGSGRADTNRRDPSGVKQAPDSPLALRVSRRAGRSPVGSTSHRAVTYFVRLGLSVVTPVTRRAPSKDSASPLRRGSATYASRSWKGLVDAAPAVSSLTCPCYHGSIPRTCPILGGVLVRRNGLPCWLSLARRRDYVR